MSTPINDTDAANEAQTDGTSFEHTVVVFGVPDEQEQLERLLIKQTDTDAATARLVVHSLPGIIPQAMPQRVAAGLATAIRGLGVNAAAIPMSEIPNLTQARQSHHLHLTNDAVEARDFSEHPFACPWGDVKVLSVGVVPSTAPTHHRSASALAMGSSHRSWNTGPNIPSRKRPEAFVVLSSGNALILSSDEMNYEYLGNRIATSSTKNFSRLIGDMMQHAGAAWVTPSTRAFLDRGPVRHYEFRSRDDFRHYTEFQTLFSSQLVERT